MPDPAAVPVPPPDAAEGFELVADALDAVVAYALSISIDRPKHERAEVQERANGAITAVRALGRPADPPPPEGDSGPRLDECCHRCWQESPHNPLEWHRMILCPECGNKRCPKATDHRLDCTGSNDAGQLGSVYGDIWAAIPPAAAGSPPEPEAGPERAQEILREIEAILETVPCDRCGGTGVKGPGVGDDGKPCPRRGCAAELGKPAGRLRVWEQYGERWVLDDAPDRLPKSGDVLLDPDDLDEDPWRTTDDFDEQRCPVLVPAPVRGTPEGPEGDAASGRVCAYCWISYSASAGINCVTPEAHAEPAAGSTPPAGPSGMCQVCWQRPYNANGQCETCAAKVSPPAVPPPGDAATEEALVLDALERRAARYLAERDAARARVVQLTEAAETIAARLDRLVVGSRVDAQDEGRPEVDRAFSRGAAAGYEAAAHRLRMMLDTAPAAPLGEPTDEEDDQSETGE